MEEQLEQFSEDPEEQMRIENELLRIKLQAQFGNGFTMETNGELPPEIEHQFLKHVMQFEENLQKAEYTTLGEKLNLKDLPSSDNMTEEQVTAELERIENVMAENSIYLDRIYGPYPDKTIYDFITKELLLQQIDSNQQLMDFIPSGEIFLDSSGADENESEAEDESDFDEYEEDENEEDNDGMDEEFDGEEPPASFRSGLHFIYEEFHPNHKADIHKQTVRFFSNWESKNFDEYNLELAKEFAIPATGFISKEQLLKKMAYFFDSFKEFKNLQLFIGEVKFAEQENELLLGHSEGRVKYTAVLEDGDTIGYDDSFKLYMEYNSGLWQIMYFIVPGWVW